MKLSKSAVNRETYRPALARTKIKSLIKYVTEKKKLPIL